LVDRSKRTDVAYVDWGCEETKVKDLALALSSGEEFVAAKIDRIEIDKAKSFVVSEPTYNPATRTVSGSVTFVGLDRVPVLMFRDCPGGGHARLQLTVTIRTVEGVSP